MNFRLLLVPSLTFALHSCVGPGSQTYREIGTPAPVIPFAISPKEAAVAGHLARELPSLLKLKPGQVRTQMDSGFVWVIVSGVSDPNARNEIERILKDYRQSHPGLSPLRLEFW